MGVNQKIIETLTPICPVVVPDFYDGNAETYITFSKYADRATDHGDSRPVANTIYVHIYLFAPARNNILDLITHIRMALFRAGFSYPSIEHGAGKDIQHVIFDTEIEDDEIIEQLKTQH